MPTFKDIFHSTYIIQLSCLLMKQADKVLGKKYTLTHAQFMVMIMLHQYGHQSQVELAAKLNLTGAAVSRLVNTLTIKGFLDRAEDPNNRRKNTLQLTKVGQKIITEAVEILMKMEKTLYGQIEPTKLTCFTEICHQLSDTLILKDNHNQ